MHRRAELPVLQPLVYIALVTAICVVGAALIGMARAEEVNQPILPASPGQVGCPSTPPGVSRECKILILQGSEIQALAGQNGILDTAEAGRPLDLGKAVQYFREKLRQAPNGYIPSEPKEPKEPGK